jgi:hypothetical protein
MSNLDQMKISFEGIAHVLEDNILTVPVHQRSFSWEDKQITEFISDISNAIDNKIKEYFLGSIVLTIKKESQHEVVDGQQRLATSCIAISAIRDYLYENGETERSLDVERDFLLKKDLRTQEIQPKLVLGNIDNEFFLKKILARADSEERSIKPSRESHEKIHNTYLSFKNLFESRVTGNAGKIDILFDWLEYLKENVKVIVVETPSYTNAFTIFETLNDRGLELAITDLLKNYIFGLSGNRLPEAQQNWNLMLGTLETVGGETITLDFIRHHWSSRNGSTREKDLYDAIKKSIQKPTEAVVFTEELSKSAVFYTSILNPQHDNWDKYGQSVRDYMATLITLRMIQIRPLLISVLSYFSIEEVKKVMPRIVSWAVRLLVTGKLGGGILDKAYSDNAKKIAANEIKTTKQLFESMKSNIPNDKEFEYAFSTGSVSNSQIARYYLRCLERQASGESEPELIPNANEEIVNLEHILPQKPEKGWELFKEDTVISYSKRIGNLAILQTKINDEIGNTSFDEKKNAYRSSKFLLTRKLAEYKNWTTTSIEERQKELAEIAVKTWPL